LHVVVASDFFSSAATIVACVNKAVSTSRSEYSSETNGSNRRSDHTGLRMSGDGGKRGRSSPKSNERRIVAEPSTAIENRWLRIVVVMHGCGSMQAAPSDIPEPGLHTLVLETPHLKF
jgi:hypothetical protein